MINSLNCGCLLIISRLLFVSLAKYNEQEIPLPYGIKGFQSPLTYGEVLNRHKRLMRNKEYTYEIFQPSKVLKPELTYDYTISSLKKKTKPKTEYSFQQSDFGFCEMDRYFLGHVTTVANALKQFSIIEPTEGCKSQLTSTPSRTAAHRKKIGKKCKVVATGGFFNRSDNMCLGNIISEGKVIKLQYHHNVNFGVREDGSIVVGYLPNWLIDGYENDKKKVENKKKFVNLVSGVIWLVRNGESFVDKSIELEDLTIQDTGSDFVTVRSARTAIGHDKNGKIISLQIDGKTWERGVDLWELADMMVNLGAVNAINLDGGGSTATVFNGVLANIPSDINETIVIPSGGEIKQHITFERPVMTTLCFHEDDYCEPDNLCSGHGHCESGKCVCDYGFEGESCEKEIDLCAKNRPCDNIYSNCIRVGEGDYKCICKQGFYGNGLHCYDINECELMKKSDNNNNSNNNSSSKTTNNDDDSSPFAFVTTPSMLLIPKCMNNSYCINQEGSFHCNCNDGFVFEKSTCVSKLGKSALNDNLNASPNNADDNNIPVWFIIIALVVVGLLTSSIVLNIFLFKIFLKRSEKKNDNDLFERVKLVKSDIDENDDEEFDHLL